MQNVFLHLSDDSKRGINLNRVKAWCFIDASPTSPAKCTLTMNNGEVIALNSEDTAKAARLFKYLTDGMERDNSCQKKQK